MSVWLWLLDVCRRVHFNICVRLCVCPFLYKFNSHCLTSAGCLRKSTVKVGLWKSRVAPRSVSGICVSGYFWDSFYLPWFLQLLRSFTISVLLALCPLVKVKLEQNAVVLTVRLFSEQLLSFKAKQHWLPKALKSVITEVIERHRCTFFENTK